MYNTYVMYSLFYYMENYHQSFHVCQSQNVPQSAGDKLLKLEMKHYQV